jgi:hypothetical protein
MQIAERLAGIRANIDAALRRSDDPQRDVTIVAVTKTHPAAVVDAVAQAGLLDVGENRVQEALAKAPDVAAPVRWHLIGHLQRNKVRAALRLFRVIHSVDSQRLVEALGATEERIRIFLQINVSGEHSKFGAPPEAARGLWRAALGHRTLDVAGLMTMAPYSDDPEAARPVFRALRELRDDLNRTGDGPPLRLLSMGMSGDYEVAVAEGATHVRIGSALLARNAG